MKLQFESIHKVVIAVTSQYQHWPTCKPLPHNQTVTQEFFIADKTATEAISIAMNNVPKAMTHIDPWSPKDEYIGNVTNKELISVEPCYVLPLGVEVFVPERTYRGE